MSNQPKKEHFDDQAYTFIPTTDIALAIENARLRRQVLAEREKVLKIETQIRKEIANQIHDGPAQLLSAVIMRLELCTQLLEKNPALVAKEIVTTQNLAIETECQMRTMLFELRPVALEMYGLNVALQSLVEQLQKNRTVPQLKLEIESDNLNGDISPQDAQVEQVLFRIAQECVNNALKHAKANHISVQLKETSRQLHLTICDDGQGFNVTEVLHSYSNRVSFGLLNIREQVELINGQLTVKSVLGEGTTMMVVVAKSFKKEGK